MISSRAIRKGITIKFDGKVVDKAVVVEASKTWEPKHATLFTKLLKQGGKFVIIDLRNMDFMKDRDGKIMYYNLEEEACHVCGINELENAWVMKLIYNHIEAQ